MRSDAAASRRSGPISPAETATVFDLFRSDIERLRRYGARSSTLRLLFDNPGLWACACYRAGNWLQRNRLPFGLRHLVLVFYHLWWQNVQLCTGISIPPDCRIGPGLYIGHFGQIILHHDVVIGRDCNLSQGVTLGLGSKGDRWGVPTLGDRVYIAPGAKVIGPIHLADGTVVGANAVVVKDTAENAVVVGVPAREISREGSGRFIG
jgi:serine O-acetyltransferase